MSNTAASGAKTNVLAIVSLVTSILGLSIVGIITGHIGMNQIKKTGESGRGLAIVGLVLGYLVLVIEVIWVAVAIAAAAALSSGGTMVG
jgi:peptidyl-prolyl cis-trans isomerase B (cyclophilin B)